MTCFGPVRRRCSQAEQLLCLLYLLALPAVALGYGSQAPIDVEGLRLAPGDQSLVTVDLARVGAHKAWMPQAFLHYADQPLALLCRGNCPNQNYVSLIAHRITLDLSVAVALWERLQLALSLPVVLYQQSDAIIQGGLTNPAANPPVPQTAGLTDAQLHAKVAFLPSSWKAGIGLAGTLSLPTGDGNSFLGTRLPSFTARLLAHGFLHPRVTLAGSFGARFASEEQILGLPSGIALTYKLGLRVNVLGLAEWPPALYLIAEAYGQAYLHPLLESGFPTEFLVSVRSEPAPFRLFAGAGSTLYPGSGTPNVRVLLGFGYSSKH